MAYYVCMYVICMYVCMYVTVYMYICTFMYVYIYVCYKGSSHILTSLLALEQGTECQASMNVAYKKPSLTLTKNVVTSYGALEGNCGETAKEKDAWWVINLETWHYVYGVGRRAFQRTVGSGKYKRYSVYNLVSTGMFTPPSFPSKRVHTKTISIPLAAYSTQALSTALIILGTHFAVG